MHGLNACRLLYAPQRTCASPLQQSMAMDKWVEAATWPAMRSDVPRRRALRCAPAASYRPPGSLAGGQGCTAPVPTGGACTTPPLSIDLHLPVACGPAYATREGCAEGRARAQESARRSLSLYMSLSGQPSHACDACIHSSQSTGEQRPSSTPRSAAVAAAAPLLWSHTKHQHRCSPLFLSLIHI